VRDRRKEMDKPTPPTNAGVKTREEQRPRVGSVKKVISAQRQGNHINKTRDIKKSKEKKERKRKPTKGKLLVNEFV